MLYADPRLQKQNPTQQNPEEEEGFFTSLAMAPLRGVAGAAAGVANLFGADVQDNFGLGHSSGVIPGLVEGFSQFLTGFIPIGGALGKIGALSTAGKTGAALAKTVATRGAVAGAASDFLVFDGNDQRLSNLIQSVPALQNPITEFLAASPDDSESWGRLKNVIEGMGLGVITDSVMSVFGHMRARNDAIAKGDIAKVKELDALAERDARAGVEDDALDQFEQELMDQEDIARMEGEGGPALPDPEDAAQPQAVQQPQAAAAPQRAPEEERVAYDLVLTGMKEVTEADLQRKTAISFTKAKETLEKAEAAGLVGPRDPVTGKRQNLALTSGAQPAPKAPQGPQAAPGSPAAPQAPKAAPAPQNAPQPAPAAPKPPAPPITVASVRQAAKWDPMQGDVLLVDVSPGNTTDFIEGMSQWDAFTPKDESSMVIFQLKKEAKLIDGWGKVAKDLIGDLRYTLRGKARKKAINDAAKAAGYDGVRWKNKNDVNVTVVNKDAVENQIQMVTSRDEVAMQAKADTLRQPEVVKKSKLESVMATAMIDQGTIGRVIDRVEDMKIGFRKIYGTATNRISSERAAQKAVADELLGKLPGLGINFTQLDAGTSGLVARAVVDELLDAVRVGAHEATPNSETIRDAAQIMSQALGNPRDFALRLRMRAEQVAEAVRDTIAGAFVVKKYAQELAGLVDEAMKRRNGQPPAPINGVAMSDEALALAFNEGTMSYHAVVSALGEVKSELGYGLQAQSIRVTDMLQDQVVANLDRKGGLEATFKRMEHFKKQYDASLDGGAAALHRAHMQTRFGRTVGIFLDYYYFSILSAIRTPTTNAIGAMMTQFYEPLERTLGGALRKLGAGPEEIAAAARQSKVDMGQVYAYTDMIAEAMRTVVGGEGIGKDPVLSAGRRAWDGGKRVTGGNGVMDSRTQGLTVDNVNVALGTKIAEDSKLGGAIGWMAKLFQLPGRIMGTTDEMLKFAEARSYIKAELAVQGQEAGLKGSALDDFIDAGIKDLIRDGQLANKEMFQREAEQKYTRELFPDPVSRQEHIQNYVANQLADQRVDLQTGAKTGHAISGRMQVADRAKLLAERTTFTGPLTKERPGLAGALTSAGLALQKYTAAHPLAKIFFPFVQTPMNLLVYASERMPIPVLNPEFSGFVSYMANRATGLGKIDAARNRFVQALSKGGPEAADAWGRASTAMGVFTLFTATASSGVLTGRGPDDPEHRALMIQAGWQPYSIKVGDTYVSYQRLDPFATMLGFVADLADFARYGGDEVEISDLAWNGVMALMTNLESKSYLAGLSDVAGLVHDPVKYVQKVGNRLAGSLIPNAVASARSMTDEYTTEVRGMLDTLMNRIPFLGNSQVAPARNLLGEKVTKKQLEGAFKLADGFAQFTSPLSFNRSSSDVVTTELANLGYPFNAQKPQKWGVDLRDYTNDKGQTAYDRWLELTGEVSIGGRKLRPAMERLVKSNAYQQLDYRSIDKADLESPRVSKIQSLLEKYRRAALVEMLGEFPALRDHTRARRIASEAMRSGDPVDSVRARLFPMENR